jgi:hypothetical protein
MAFIFALMVRWYWTRLWVMRIMAAAASQFFPMMMMWPANRDEVKVLIYATDEFALKSCLSSYNAIDLEQAEFGDDDTDDGTVN